MVQEGSQSFTYDASDQLTRIDTPGAITIYSRDPLDRPAQQTQITTLAEIGTSNASTTAASSVSLAVPAGTQPGDLLVASVTAAAGSPVVPSGWSSVATQTNGTDVTWVATHVYASSDPSSWSFGQSVPTTILAAAVDYRNPNPSTPIDVEASQNDAAGTSQALPQVTTTGSGETILHVVGYDSDTTPSAPAGDSSRYSTSSTLASLLVSDRYQALPGQSAAATATSSLAAASQAITVALVPQSVTQRLGYTGQSDVSGIVQSTSGTTTGVRIALPGGESYTTNGSAITWAYTNVHGDTITTTDNSGNLTWTGYWGPYGENASGNGMPSDTALGGDSYGYNGAQGKLTDGNLTLMGARPYVPSDGRFIQPDPIQGGCANDYTYAFGDPLNHTDLSGQGWFSDLWNSVKCGLGGVLLGAASVVAGAAGVAAAVAEAPAVITVLLGIGAVGLGVGAADIDARHCQSSGLACLGAVLGGLGAGVGLGGLAVGGYAAVTGSEAAKAWGIGLGFISGSVGAEGALGDTAGQLVKTTSKPCR